MVPHKFLILKLDPSFKSAIEEFLSEGPYEILFAQGGIDGLKNSKKAEAGVGTAELQLRNVQGITGLKIARTAKMEATLVVVDSAASLNLTDALIKFDIVGKLDNASQKEEHRETPDNSVNSQQSYWKTGLESFLDANYSNPDLSFDDFISEFRFTRSYGCRLFKQHLGKPFLGKLREIRIARAERLITETQMSMKEIAAECGFRSSKRLYEAFVRIHGISPVQYRKRIFRKDRFDAPLE